MTGNGGTRAIGLMLAGLALSGCAGQAEGAESGLGAGTNARLAGLNSKTSESAVKLGIFDKSSPTSLPDKFGQELSGLGEFDIRLAGTLSNGEEFYVGRNQELICVVYGIGNTEANLMGGLSCNTGENVLRLGLWGVRTDTSGTQRTVALVPDDCTLVPDDKSPVDKLMNVQIMHGGDGIIRCNDGDIDISSVEPLGR